MITMKKQGSEQAVLFLMAEEPHLVKKVFLKGREVFVVFEDGPTMPAGFISRKDEQGGTVKAWKITKHGEDKPIGSLVKVARLELKLVIGKEEEVVHTDAEASVEAATSPA